MFDVMLCRCRKNYPKKSIYGCRTKISDNKLKNLFLYLLTVGIGMPVLPTFNSLHLLSGYNEAISSTRHIAKAMAKAQ